MNAVLIAVISVVAPAVFSLIGAILLGKLVPVSQVTVAEAKVAVAEAKAEKWRLAYEEKSAAFDKLEDVVNRQQIVTEAVNQVFAALKQTTQTPLPPGQPRGGPT